MLAIVYLQNIAGTAKKMAARDLTQEVNPQSGQDVLGVAFKDMSSNLRDTVGQVLNSAENLAAASQVLEVKANSVAAAAEDMSSNTISVAASMEQASTNLRSVASATEEMTSTIGEIARNSEKAHQVTGQAVVQAARITSVFNELARSTREIDAVNELITAISRQTNLLALNATIEAARAGVSGKGFAVVASEIKDLANQTSAATGDIKNKIERVQQFSGQAVEDIGNISGVIGEISDIVASIAGAIEEQSIVTRDIALNISQATQGVDHTNERVASTAVIVQSVTRDIRGKSGGDSSGEKNILSSVRELADLALKLNVVVAQFEI